MVADDDLNLNPTTGVVPEAPRPLDGTAVAGSALDGATGGGVGASRDGGAERVARLRDEVVALTPAGATDRRERILGRIGAALLVLGPAWVAVEYLIAHFSTSSLEQRDALVGAVFGLALTVTGMALFLRYTGARFLRFWLARLSYEQHHHTAQVVDAITDRASGEGA